MKKINCTQALENTKWLLLKTGVWPVEKLGGFKLVQVIFHLFVDLILFIAFTWNIVTSARTRNLELLNRMVSLLIPSLNYIAKSLTLLINRKCFLSLLEDLRSNIFNDHDERGNEHVRVIYKISTALFRFFGFILMVFITVGSVLPFVMNASYIIPPPFNTGRFDFVYKFIHFFFTIILACNMLGFDGLYLTLMSLAIAQLNILEEQLTNMVEDIEFPFHSKECTGLRITVILKKCIILHENINRFVEKLSICLSFPLFVQYALGCFVICNTILQLTLLNVSVSISTNILFMCGCFIAVGEMTTYHWLGNEIIFKSSKVIESTYVSKWYTLDIKHQKILLLLMERAKRPTIIHVYSLIDISLDSLGVVFRWAYSLVALIKAKYN